MGDIGESSGWNFQTACNIAQEAPFLVFPMQTILNRKKSFHLAQSLLPTKAPQQT